MPFPSNHLKYLQGSQAFLSCSCVAVVWPTFARWGAIANIKCGHHLNSMQSAGCMLPRVPLWYHLVFFSLIPSSFSKTFLTKMECAAWQLVVQASGALFTLRWFPQFCAHGPQPYDDDDDEDNDDDMIVMMMMTMMMMSRSCIVGSPKSVRTAPRSLFSSFALLLGAVESSNDFQAV